MSSEYYLNQIPVFFKNGYGPPCNAGSSFLTATPDGHIKRCSEMPAVCHYTDYEPNYFTLDSILPEFYNTILEPLADTVAPPTLGGLLPDMTQQRLDAALQIGIMNDDISVDKKYTKFATSSGSPNLDIGIFER